MRKSGAGFLEERISNSFDGFEPLARIGVFEPLANTIRPALAQVLELIANEEADQVAELEALDRLARGVSGFGGEIECVVEIVAFDLDPGRAIMLEEAIEPVRWAIKRAAEIEQDRVRFRHGTSLTAKEPRSPARPGIRG